MTTLFKSKLIPSLGTTPTIAFTSSGTSTTTVIGLSFTNLTDSIVLASVQINDTVANTSAYFLKNVILPPNQSLRVINGGERLVMGPSTNLIVSANADASLDTVISYVEIS
jgi:hypothetical protein